MNGKSKYVLVKEEIVHRRKDATTAKQTMTKIYMARMSGNEESLSRDSDDQFDF